MRVLLDTNILLDVLLRRVPHVDESTAALLRCRAVRAEIWIAWHGLATAYYFLRRGRSLDEAMRDVDRLLGWAVVAPVVDADARRARDFGFTDFEDALQAVAAERCEANWLVTRNTADFANSPVLAITPAEFLQSVPAP